MTVAAASPSPPRRGGAARGPCPGGWPLGVGGRPRLHAPAGARHRPTQRHVGGHPSPSAARAGLRARPSPPVRPRRWLPAAAPRAELAACFLLASLELGSHWRELRASLPPTHLRSGALLSSSPFLKGQCPAAGSARAGSRGCGRASAASAPHKCTNEADPGRHLLAAAA